MSRPTLADWLKSFLPAPIAVDARERVRGVAGAAIGILFVASICRWLLPGTPAGAWLVAPLGASAVLVFAVPASPLAQPWAVVGGNALSAIVGVLCSLAIGDPLFAGPVAVAAAISAMFLLRCLHPPGGAMALLAVLVHARHGEFAWLPALMGSALLVAAGVAYNTVTGRRYPHSQVVLHPSPAPVGARFASSDVDAVLARYNQVLDVSRDDLEMLLQDAEMEGYRRRMGEILCADVMSGDPVSVEFGTPLRDAWDLMRGRRIKALPVIDRSRRLVGIVTLADFMRHAGIDRQHDIGGRLRALIRPDGRTHSDKPEVVGQIMTRQVRVASVDRHVAELMPLFAEGGHHHIPIIDGDGRLVGMITQSDFVRALYRTDDVPAA
jgi:CBS domain-containing membrane protein